MHSLNCLSLGVIFSLRWEVVWHAVLVSGAEVWMQLLRLGWYRGADLWIAASLRVISGEEIDGRGCEPTLYSGDFRILILHICWQFPFLLNSGFRWRIEFY